MAFCKTCTNQLTKNGFCRSCHMTAYNKSELGARNAAKSGITNTDKPKCEEHRSKISSAIKQGYADGSIVHGMSGKKHTDCAKEKMSLAKRGFIPWNKGRKHKPSTRMKMSKMARQRLTRNFNTSPNHYTDIEFIFARLLSSHGIIFEHNATIGRFYVDFLIGNIVIECDGSYWHSKPQDKAHDRKRQAIIERQGYTVIRLTDTEIFDKGLKEIFISKLQSMR